MSFTVAGEFFYFFAYYINGFSVTRYKTIKLFIKVYRRQWAVIFNKNFRFMLKIMNKISVYRVHHVVEIA